MSYCCASSASVFSPLMAASATFALKAGLWVRRARLAIVAPDPQHSRRSQADFPLIGLSEFARPPLMAGVAASDLVEIGFDTQISASNQLLTLHPPANPCHALNK